MKILHIVEDFSLESGGLRTVIKDLNNHLNENNFHSHVLSSKKEDNEENIFIIDTKLPWGYSRNWKTMLSELHKKNNYEIFHIHGVWMYPQLVAAKFCKRNNIPFILSTHGMYEPKIWQKGTLKKKIYFNLLAKKKFEKANTIHAITQKEKINLSKLFKKNKIVEIPNLISSLDTVKIDNESTTEKYILFLGRLDEVKGIDILLNAVYNLKQEDFKLKIAGGINDYYKTLLQITKQLNIENKVEFLGLVSGDEKISLIKKALALVAPSHSEVIGMVNLEAAILKTPVITTYQTGLKKEWNKNGGFLINPNSQELTLALKRVLKWDKLERDKNGKMLYSFVKKHYSWSKKFSSWRKLYLTING